MAAKGKRKRVSKSKVAEVRARDKDICQICFLLVVEGYGSIDHILRVTEGGGNELTNLRWTHKKCNNERHLNTAKTKRNQKKKAAKARARRLKPVSGRPNPKNSGGADPYRCQHCKEWPSQGHKEDCPDRDDRTFEEKLAAQKQDEDEMLKRIAK